MRGTGRCSSSGAVPALMFGVAFGNLFLGVPFHFDELGRPVYTGGFFGLLHPFALLCGLVTSLAMLVMHGAAYAALKVGEPMRHARAPRRARSRRSCCSTRSPAAGVWLMSLDGYRITGAIDAAGPSNPLRKTVETVRGAWLGRLRRPPAFWLAPIGVYVGVLAMFVLQRVARPGLAFVASALATAGVILTAGFALFPFLLPSSTSRAPALPSGTRRAASTRSSSC